MAAVLGVRFLAACSLLAAARGGSLRFLSMTTGVGCNFAQETQGKPSFICATWTEQASSNEGDRRQDQSIYGCWQRGASKKMMLLGRVGISRVAVVWSWMNPSTFRS